jgi:hypothetical protein
MTLISPNFGQFSAQLPKASIKAVTWRKLIINENGRYKKTNFDPMTKFYLKTCGSPL